VKQALKDELVAALTAALEAARRAHASALEGATHAEAKAENDKDTRGLEQSYLARGQAQRAHELAAALDEVEASELRRFVLVTVDEDGDQLRYLIAPHGGGTVLGGGIQVVTPQSPLGRALTAKQIDDVVEVKLKDKIRELTVLEIE
jgi:transcription elongation GreA/GreB family factor